MKIALKDGLLRVREITDFQFQVMRSWGKFKWDKTLKEFSCHVDLEVLDNLARIVTLPEPIEQCRLLLKRQQQAVDKLRMCENVKPLIGPPIKEGIKPYDHQIRAYNMALVTFGLVDPKKILEEKPDEPESDTSSLIEKAD